MFDVAFNNNQLVFSGEPLAVCLVASFDFDGGYLENLSMLLLVDGL